MKIYAISGLGADHRVFENIDIGFPIHVLQWETISTEDDMRSYALKLQKQIDQSAPFGIIGVSFGGMLAAEIALLCEPVFTILISSAATKLELPTYFRWVGKIGMLSIIPTSFFDPPRRLAAYFFGTKNKALLHSILDDSDPKFVKWAAQAIVSWRNETVAESIFQIKGDSDRILPAHKSDNTILIKDGGHLMIVDWGFEISKFIAREISCKVH